MYSDYILDRVPVLPFFIAFALIALLPIEAGQRLGARRRRKTDHEPEGPVGNVVGATLALLAFIMALTVSAAVSRFDARKEVLIDGVNAIESAYRNASLLPEPYKSESRKLLREYVEMGLSMHELFGKPEELRKLDTRVRAIQGSLWSYAEALAKEDRNSEVYALFPSSLNEMIQIHNKRMIIGAQHRIPLPVWAVLVIVTVMGMLLVGFQFGLAGSRSLIANLMLALTFALVMTLTFDLDQPGKGVIGVNQQPMYDLYERLRTQK